MFYVFEFLWFLDTRNKYYYISPCIVWTEYIIEGLLLFLVFRKQIAVSKIELARIDQRLGRMSVPRVSWGMIAATLDDAGLEQYV